MSMGAPTFREKSGFVIVPSMTKLMDAAEKARTLPDDVQDYLARAVLSLVRLAAEPAATAPDERRFVLEGLLAVRRGELASDQEVEAAFRRFEH